MAACARPTRASTAPVPLSPAALDSTAAPTSNATATSSAASAPGRCGGPAKRAASAPAPSAAAAKITAKERVAPTCQAPGRWLVAVATASTTSSKTISGAASDRGLK